MVIRHILAVLGLFCLAPFATAAEVRLGPEVPFADVAPRPATVSTNCMAAASNGRDFLIGWGWGAGFAVTRVRRDGTRAELHPRSTDDANCGSQIVPRGDGYLLVLDNLRTVQLDESGGAVSPPRILYTDASRVAFGPPRTPLSCTSSNRGSAAGPAGTAMERPANDPPCPSNPIKAVSTRGECFLGLPDIFSNSSVTRMPSDGP